MNTSKLILFQSIRWEQRRNRIIIIDASNSDTNTDTIHEFLLPTPWFTLMPEFLPSKTLYVDSRADEVAERACTNENV